MNKNQLTEEYIKKHFGKNNNLSKFINESLASNVDRSILENQLYEAKDKALGNIVDYHIVESIRKSRRAKQDKTNNRFRYARTSLSLLQTTLPDRYDFHPILTPIFAMISASSSLYRYFSDKDKDEKFINSPHAREFVSICKSIEMNMKVIEIDIKKIKYKLDEDSLNSSISKVITSSKDAIKDAKFILNKTTITLSDISEMIENSLYTKMSKVRPRFDIMNEKINNIKSITDNNKKALVSPDIKSNSNFNVLSNIVMSIEKVTNILERDLSLIGSLLNKMDG